MLTRLPRRGSKKGPQVEQTRGPSPSGSHARRDVTTLAAHLPPCLRTHTRPPLRKHPSLSSFSSGLSRSSQLLLPPQGSRHGQAPGLHPLAVSPSPAIAGLATLHCHFLLAGQLPSAGRGHHEGQGSV